MRKKKEIIISKNGLPILFLSLASLILSYGGHEYISEIKNLQKDLIRITYTYVFIVSNTVVFQILSRAKNLLGLQWCGFFLSECVYIF